MILDLVRYRKWFSVDPRSLSAKKRPLASVCTVEYTPNTMRTLLGIALTVCALVIFPTIAQASPPTMPPSVISAGADHMCALLTSGAIKCWGNGDKGQLGNGDTQRVLAPVDVVDITNATSIAAGGKHTCALLEGGTVKCWGRNDHGQLGNGKTEDASTPVAVEGITNATMIDAGGSSTCALLKDGTVKCWGLAMLDSWATAKIRMH